MDATDGRFIQSSHIRSLRAYLISIRQPYLSTAQPVRRREQTGVFSKKSSYLADGARKTLSDQQRDQIDAESKQLLRDANMAIQNLAEAERLRQRAEATLAQKRRATGALGGLKVWASGRSEAGKTPVEALEDAQANTICLHRESVLWYLRRQLESCSECQMKMMEIRLTRDLEKSKSRLYPAHGSTVPTSTALALELSSANAGSGGGRHHQGDPSSGSTMQLSSEQLQLFAEENQQLLKQYEDTIEQVRRVLSLDIHSSKVRLIGCFQNDGTLAH